MRTGKVMQEPSSGTSIAVTRPSEGTTVIMRRTFGGWTVWYQEDRKWSNLTGVLFSWQDILTCVGNGIWTDLRRASDSDYVEVGLLKHSDTLF